MAIHRWGSASAQIAHGILEEGATVSGLAALAPRPARVVPVEQVALRVRHETEHAPGHVGDAGDAVHRAVGMLRVLCFGAVGSYVSDDDLLVLLELVEDFIQDLGDVRG